MKSILLTGGTGFIGSHLIYELAKKYKVYTIVRKKKFYKNKNIISLSLNQLKKNKQKKFYALIHLATHYKSENNILEFRNFLNSNILFGIEILETINLKKISKIMYFSTMMEHLDSKIYNPLNLYASSKKSFQDVIMFYKNKYKNIKFYNIKLYETFGPNDKRKKIIPLLIKNYKTKKKIILVSKELKLNFISVYDVCLGIKILLEKKIKSDTYLMKAKKNTKILNLIKMLNLEKNVTYLNIKQKNFKFKFKMIPNWKPNYTIEKYIKSFT